MIHPFHPCDSHCATPKRCRLSLFSLKSHAHQRMEFSRHRTLSLKFMYCLYFLLAWLIHHMIRLLLSFTPARGMVLVHVSVRVDSTRVGKLNFPAVRLCVWWNSHFPISADSPSEFAVFFQLFISADGKFFWWPKRRKNNFYLFHSLLLSVYSGFVSNYRADSDIKWTSFKLPNNFAKIKLQLFEKLSIFCIELWIIRIPLCIQWFIFGEEVRATKREILFYSRASAHVERNIWRVFVFRPWLEFVKRFKRHEEKLITWLKWINSKRRNSLGVIIFFIISVSRRGVNAKKEKLHVSDESSSTVMKTVCWLCERKTVIAKKSNQDSSISSFAIFAVSLIFLVQYN